MSPVPPIGTLFADPPAHPTVPAYDRSPSNAYREIDRFSDGVGWLAHPRETGRRASHAVRGDDGVWLLDPLDAPGVDELIGELGEVVGVAVLSNWHARDAGGFARRHGVAVHLPEWMTRVAARIDASVEQFTGTFGDAGFRVRRLQPLPGWREGVAVRETDGTLYVPESMGAAPGYVVGSERLGVAAVCRFFPPRQPFVDVEPERVLVGHGAGVLESASSTLRDALAGARRRSPGRWSRTGRRSSGRSSRRSVIEGARRLEVARVR